MTTLDLFRLVRNRRRSGWPESTVAPLLYKDGRGVPSPLHSERVGAVDGFLEKVGAVTIAVTDAGFGVGDEFAFVLPIDYEQQLVESIHLDDDSVDQANVRDRVGIKTALTKEQARNGVKVYRVREDVPFVVELRDGGPGVIS